MFTETAEYYDLIYGSFKDYESEAAELADSLRRLHPGAREILDVACGTGEHARYLGAEHGVRVDGIDLDANLLAVARSKNPDSVFTCADMTAFALDRRYDAVVCLFSSIGYAKTPDGVTDALKCFNKHLNPGGVVLVEPWFPPGGISHGYTTVRTVEDGDRKICRMTRNEVHGRLSRLYFEYMIGDTDGIARVSEVHELGLLTEGEMMAAFADAGLVAEYDPMGISGRGMYTARRR